MKTSQALRLTKAKLWDGVSPRPEGKAYYGCDAASMAGVYSIVSPILIRLLGGPRTLGGWLFDRGNYEPRDTVKMQATRHAWLDHLIEHYEALND